MGRVNVNEIVELHGKGKSLRQIAEWLKAERGIKISPQGVKYYVDRLKGNGDKLKRQSNTKQEARGKRGKRADTQITPEMALEVIAEALEARKKLAEVMQENRKLRAGYENVRDLLKQQEEKNKKILTAAQRFRLAQQQGDIGGDN